LKFEGTDPQNVVDNYLKYYKENTGESYFFCRYEVFGMLSPIVWKIWSIIYNREVKFKFGNIIRLKQKAMLPHNYWINSENPAGIID